MEREREKRREQERGRELRGKGNTRINQSIPMLASILTCNDSLEVQVTLPYYPFPQFSSLTLMELTK